MAENFLKLGFRERARMTMSTVRTSATAAATFFSLLVSTGAHAIPTTLVHLHTDTTVEWQQPGSPPLPWDHPTANSWNHNHLTPDPFNNAPSWVINKAWDDRTLHNSLDGAPATGFGHGLIRSDMYVRFGWGANFANAAARNEIAFDYGLWQDAARVQFNLNADPWDHLAIRFRRVDAGEKEITINFVEGLQELGSYGLTQGGGPQTIDFEETPNFVLDTGSDDISISLDGGLTFARRRTVSTPWSFDGTPNLFMDDLNVQYQDASGTHETGAGVGLANLQWNFGTLSADDTIDIWQMDFRTIALHEIGHSIALGHTGDGSAGIMRNDIALNAHFGRTQGIDSSSALAVAIDYTFVPTPATLTLLGLGLLVLAVARRRASFRIR